MASLIHPILFSQKFGCDATAFSDARLIEPILNCDTPLFIDPTLIRTSQNEIISGAGYSAMRKRFDQIFQLAGVYRKSGNQSAYEAALKLLNIDEFRFTHLGYGSSRTSGTDRPRELRERALSTVLDMIELGEVNSDLISLIGLFEDGIGPDAIGDFAAHCISEQLVSISSAFYREHDLPTRQFAKFGGADLVPDPSAPDDPILLVPHDIVRDLPLATDWSDVNKAVSEIEEIRDKFNSFFVGVARPLISEKKAALREVVFSSPEMLKALADALLELATNYDPNQDIFNYFAIRKIFSGEIDVLPNEKVGASINKIEDLMEVVRLSINYFKKQVENNNLWELLWSDGRPKRERAAQLAFYAVSDVYCKFNDIDITPEANMGGGPVDFKFSKGYDLRVVVELKMSTGRVVHGYSKQLEIYKKASETEDAIFIVIDVGGIGQKLKEIKRLREYRRQTDKKTSEIVVIDARQRDSASKP